MPNRTPSHLKTLRGTQRASRTKNRPEPKPGSPKPPSWLKGEALKEWKRVIPVLEEMGLLTRADRAVLARYCQAWARWVGAERVIAKEGATYRSGDLVKRHPAVGDALEQSKSMKGFMVELGLTPRVRQSLDVVPPRPKARGGSVMDELLAKRDEALRRGYS